MCNKNGALLKGILRCASCKCGMTPAFSNKGNRLYRYYVCNQAQQRGWATCPAPSAPAGEIERFVVEEIRPVAGDPAVLKEVARNLRQDAGDKTARLCRERDLLRQELGKTAAELEQQAMAFSAAPSSVDLAVQLNERMRIAQDRLSEIDEQLSELAKDEFEDGEVARLLSDFNSVWAGLSTREPCRVIDLLIERVEYDGKSGAIAITFRQTGIESLKLGNHSQEDAA